MNFKHRKFLSRFISLSSGKHFYCWFLFVCRTKKFFVWFTWVHDFFNTDYTKLKIMNLNVWNSFSTESTTIKTKLWAQSVENWAWGKSDFGLFKDGKCKETCWLLRKDESYKRLLKNLTQGIDRRKEGRLDKVDCFCWINVNLGSVCMSWRAGLSESSIRVQSYIWRNLPYTLFKNKESYLTV